MMKSGEFSAGGRRDENMMGSSIGGFIAAEDDEFAADTKQIGVSNIN